MTGTDEFSSSDIKAKLSNLSNCKRSFMHCSDDLSVLICIVYVNVRSPY